MELLFTLCPLISVIYDLTIAQYMLWRLNDLNDWIKKYELNGVGCNPCYMDYLVTIVGNAGLWSLLVMMPLFVVNNGPLTLLFLINIVIHIFIDDYTITENEIEKKLNYVLYHILFGFLTCYVCGLI